MKHEDTIIAAFSMEEVKDGPEDGFLAFLTTAPCRHPLHVHEQLAMGIYEAIGERPRSLNHQQKKLMNALGIEYVPGESWTIPFGKKVPIEEKYEPMLRDPVPEDDEPLPPDGEDFDWSTISLMQKVPAFAPVIERLAEGAWNAVRSSEGATWEEISNTTRNSYRAMTRAILKALGEGGAL